MTREPRLFTIYAGARPNAPKIWTLLAGLRRYTERSMGPPIRWRVVHTNQHHHSRLGVGYFADLGIPIDENLRVGSMSSDGEQLGALISRIEQDLHASRPSAMVAVGDVNTTLAAAIVGSRNGYPVIHVEAGLRALTPTPEEVNRRLITPCAAYHLAPSERAVRNLYALGIAPERVFHVGNLMAECFLRHADERRESKVLAEFGLTEGEYVLVTLHKAGTLADPASVLTAIAALSRAGERVVFPCHPRTEQALAGASGGPFGDIRSLTVPPQRYADFGRLIEGSRAVVTDSDGVQEECAVAGVPCLTVVRETARPETVECGSNRLVGPSSDLVAELRTSCGTVPLGRPARWDDQVSRRLAEAFASIAPDLPIRAGLALRASATGPRP